MSEAGSSPTSSPSIHNLSESESKESASEEKITRNEWAPMDEIPPVEFLELINDIFLELKDCDQSIFYIQGGAPRDTYLGIDPNDLDIRVILKNQEPDTEMRAVNIVTKVLHARKDSYIKNRYTIPDTNVDITITSVDSSQTDFLINSFAIFPLYEDTQSKFKGIFHFNKRYFKNSKEAFQHLQKKELRSPKDPHKNYSEDPLRILRGCRLNTTRFLRLPPKEKDAISGSSQRA